MKLHEYQTKKLFSKYGINIPQGKVARTPKAAAAVFKELKLDSAVIKAQILAGSRGKAGGIKKVHSETEAEQETEKMLGTRLISAQSGKEGEIIRHVLVEEAINIKQELYLAITIDRCSCLPVMLASQRGGMDIEEVAKTNPEAIIRENIDPFIGLMPFQSRRIIKKLAQGSRLEVKDETFHHIAAALSRLFLNLDASLAEINPLALAEDGSLIALDAKLNIDDNALFRHPDMIKLKDSTQEDPLETRASRCGLSYVGLSGNIGCMVNGAGLAMATMDLIKSCKGEPANFLDVGGSADKDRIKTAFEIILSDEKVAVIFVNIFGGIVRCDIIAEGILEAAKTTNVRCPLVMRLEGTNKDEGRQLLVNSNLNITVASTMDDAAKRAVELAYQKETRYQ